MADISGLNKLVALRQSAKISQKEAGALIGVDRKAFAKWESHQAIPERRHRLPLLQYLLETLGLADDPHTLKDLWESVAVALWEWDMLSKSERWFIERVQHSSQPSTDAPALPPYLYIPSLVGRSDFINTFKDALRPGRSLALIGIPGVGKSAIAITVANDQDIRNRYSDGVLWANLGKKPDLLGTLATWGVALGRDLSALATIEQRAHAIRNAIGNRSMLLIIDDAWDQHTAQQLQCGGPYSCHMLLTRVQSVAEAFATPQHVHRLSELDDAQGYELLQQLAPNAWDVDQEGAKALARSVGGLPLALNVLGGYLAAPERRFFANTVRSKLTDLMDTQRRLRLALYRLGTTNDRAFTLQQVIELSLDNLPNIAVQTFFNLGAFASKPNWFDRQAAESVTLCSTDHLGLLIDRNLLEIGNFERLSIHQVLADFARTRTQRVMYERHRAYYHRLVRQDPDQWREIELFYPQLRWAWQCQRLYADHENRYNLLDVVRLYQHRRGLWQDYLEWSEETLEIARNENRPDIVASLLTSRAVVYDTLGDRTLALELHKQSLDLKIQIGDKRGEAIVLQNIASVFHQTGDRKSALDYYQRALGMMKQLEDASGMATILNNLGMLSTDLENIEDAFEVVAKG